MVARECLSSNGTQIKVVKPAVKEPVLRGDVAVFDDQVIVANVDNHQLLSFTRDLDFVKKIDLHSGCPVGVLFSFFWFSFFYGHSIA